MRDGIRLRLCIMMFLEYAVWGAWGVSIGGYMYETLHFDGTQVGWMFSTTALAAMISPLFVGYFADRFFATEKLLTALHLIGAILLLIAAFTHGFTQLFIVMQAYALCYMPTLALTNSISFANIADAKRDFPGIRVWGTWGWIIAGWTIGFLVGGKTNGQFLVAAGLSFLLAAFCLYLPHTPPRAKSAPTTQTTGGQSVFRLLADPTFLVFVVCSFLICIPLSFYYSQANGFLEQLEAPYPTALQTIGQLSEVGFMAAMPFFIARLGVKRMLTVGMLAWVLRYMAFASLSLPAVLFGLFLHGVCYDFYFVASYIYVDTRVDERQRASAQSFIAFVMLGVGMFVGSIASGATVDHFPPLIQVKAEVTSKSQTREERLPLPEWDAGRQIAVRHGPSFGAQFGCDAVDDSRGLHGDRQDPRHHHALRPCVVCRKCGEGRPKWRRQSRSLRMGDRPPPTVALDLVMAGRRRPSDLRYLRRRLPRAGEHRRRGGRWLSGRA